jgi:ribosomal protein S18 acetylase RimI-like enzyme
MPQGRTAKRSGVASRVSLDVRLVSRDGPEAPADRDFVKTLGRGSAISSVGTMRRVAQAAPGVAFDRLYEVVESQSHLTFIAYENDQRVGFLLLLDQLPDEVTLMDQAFVAYMAVDPARRGSGVGTALLAAAEVAAKRRGLPHIALMVSEENDVARSLYERGGYRTERRLLCKAL